MLLEFIKGIARYEKMENEVIVSVDMPSIDFYLSLGAIPMKEWTVYRLDAAALEQLDSNN